jgi:hypothetical protein
MADSHVGRFLHEKEQTEGVMKPFEPVWSDVWFVIDPIGLFSPPGGS